MKKSKFTDEHIVFALKQAELGTSELRQLRQPQEENAKLKRLVVDLALDKAMLQDALS